MMSFGRLPKLPRALCRAAWLTLILDPLNLAADPGTEELEARLGGAAGRERIGILVELVESYREIDAQKAASYGEEAVEHLRSDPDVDLELQVSSALCVVFKTLIRYEDALSHGLRAEKLARAKDDREALAPVLNNLADVYRLQGAYERALEISRDAIALHEALGDPVGLGNALTNAGITFRKVGDHTRALEYHLRAYEVYEQSGDRRSLAGVLNNIAIVQRILGEYEKSLVYFTQALEIQRQEGNDGAISRILNNMGVVYKHQGHAEAALAHYRQSLEIKQRLGDRIGVARSLNNIGAAHRELGQLREALRNYEDSLEIKEEIGDRLGVARTLINVARVHQDSERPDLALPILERSIEISSAAGAHDELQDAYQELSESLAAMGRFEESLAAFKEYERNREEIFNERNTEVVAEMQARFESEQRDKEIQVLKQARLSDALELERSRSRRDQILAAAAVFVLVVLVIYVKLRFETQKRLLENENLRKEERELYISELEAKKAEVETRNAEMERFTYTVSHDLKSPLITIQGFLGFLSRDAAAGNSEQMQADIARIRSAATTMGRLLDELLELSRIGRVVNAPEEVAMTDLAHEVEELLASRISERGVAVEIPDDLPSVVGDRQRLLEVLQNLMENAVRFMGDQPAPRIELGARRTGEETVFFVRDNGVGIAPGYQEKIFGLFERLDADIEGTGIGLALVRRIVEVHGGRVWVESEGEGRGCAFFFTLSDADTSSDAARRPVGEGLNRTDTL